MNKEELNEPSRIVYLKIQLAYWADELRISVLKESGLHTSGCPICGTNETCDVCNRCDAHHEQPLDLSDSDLRQLAISAFFTNFCRSNADEMTTAMMGIAHPNEVMDSYEMCPKLLEEQEPQDVNLDPDIWGEFFSDD